MAQGSQLYFGYSVRMDEQECISCGCPFAAPKIMIDQRRQNKDNFYCPNGHAQCYRESDADQLRKQLTAAQQRAEMEAASRRTAEQEAERVRKKLKRAEKRIGNGVCPCCNRHFVSVERHMKTKHPELAADGGAKPETTGKPAAEHTNKN